jgi:NAD(P)-dependent dehydrogenase (short-subunit alcohol dehydrogenase family)
MTELAGKHILVTGATGGLGSRVVRELLAAGAKVSLAGRNESALNAIAPTAPRYMIDLALPGAGQALLEAAASTGELDGIVLLHGVVAFGSAAEIPSATARTLTAVNLDSVVEIISSAVPLLQASAAAGRDPFILTVSGVIADMPTMGMASYGASKAGLKAYVQAASRELRRAGIRLFDARPGHTLTELSLHPLAGTAPAMPSGLDPDAVVQRLVTGIANDEKDLPAEAFA